MSQLSVAQELNWPCEVRYTWYAEQLGLVNPQIKYEKWKFINRLKPMKTCEKSFENPMETLW